MTDGEMAELERVMDEMDPPVPHYLRQIVRAALRGEPIAIIMPRQFGRGVARAMAEALMRAEGADA